MAVFGWITLGILFGGLAHFFDKQDAKGGLFGALLFGISGALLGGIVATWLFGSASSIEFMHLLLALSGALMLLVLHRTLFSKQERF